MLTLALDDVRARRARSSQTPAYTAQCGSVGVDARPVLVLVSSERPRLESRPVRFPRGSGSAGGRLDCGADLVGPGAPPTLSRGARRADRHESGKAILCWHPGRPARRRGARVVLPAERLFDAECSRSRGLEAPSASRSARTRREHR
jgi:hypothetical protein